MKTRHKIDPPSVSGALELLKHDSSAVMDAALELIRQQADRIRMLESYLRSTNPVETFAEKGDHDPKLDHSDECSDRKILNWLETHLFQLDFSDRKVNKSAELINARLWYDYGKYWETGANIRACVKLAIEHEEKRRNEK